MHLIEKMRAKLHNAVVNEANLNYEGSVTIGKSLLQYSGIEEREKVQVLNIDTGARIETYVIVGKDREICLNGAAARLFQKGDHVIIIAYQYEMRGYLVSEATGYVTPSQQAGADFGHIVILDGSPDNEIKEIK